MKKIVILTIAIFAASCSDNLEDLNKNKKDPAVVSGESLFTHAQKSLVDQMVDLNVNNNNTKLWSQFLQETTYTDESNYDQAGRSIPDTHWSVLYKDVLKDLDEAAKIIGETTYLTEGENIIKPNKLAIIEILNVYAYSILIQTYGDVPYSKALDIDNLLPAYDDGLTTYKDLIVRLSAAIDKLDVNLESFGSGDNIYAGDVASWKKFAASLKLRMGMLLSDVDGAAAKTVVEEAVATGVFTSNADNADFKYLSSPPNTNPIHANLIISGRHDFVAGITIVDMMNALDDPRRPLFFTTVDGAYVGGVIGSASGYSTHSHVSAQVEEATAMGDIFDYAEVEFLLAEAVERSYAVGGTAAEHYTAGVTASILAWGGTTSEAVTYVAQPMVDYATALANSTAATPWKEVIGNQKWLALYNRGIEAWTSIRRLDFPMLNAAEEPISGYPVRYTYPIVEQTLNGVNWKAASDAIGGDLPETKLFWDME